MNGTIYVGDVGTEISLNCGVDVTAATVRKVAVRKPDGTIVSWDAIADGPRSIKRVVQSGDLDQHGTYILQANVTLPNWSGLGKPAYLNIADRFMPGS